MISNNKKAVIHIAKAQVGMSDVEYRDMLGGFGVASSKDLTSPKFDLVMEHFKSLGFKRKKKSGKPISSKARLLRKITTLSVELGLDHKYADGIARQMFKVCLCAWCDAGQLRKIVAALMYYKKRKTLTTKSTKDTKGKGLKVAECQCKQEL